MFNSQSFDRLSDTLIKNMPDGLSKLGQDIQGGLKATLKANLERMDLVSREEYDIQTEVLSRALDKLNYLEQRLKELEEMVAGK